MEFCGGLCWCDASPGTGSRAPTNLWGLPAGELGEEVWVLMVLVACPGGIGAYGILKVVLCAIAISKSVSILLFFEVDVWMFALEAWGNVDIEFGTYDFEPL